MRTAQRKESAVHLHEQNEQRELSMVLNSVQHAEWLVEGSPWCRPTMGEHVPFQKQQSEDLDYESLVNT